MLSVSCNGKEYEKCESLKRMVKSRIMFREGEDYVIRSLIPEPFLFADHYTILNFNCAIPEERVQNIFIEYVWRPITMLNPLDHLMNNYGILTQSMK